MNAILQKRIEEAAKAYAWSHDTIGIDKETFHTETSQKHSIPIDKHVRVPIQHEMEVAFKCAAHFILNNLWISVEEDLPEEDIPNCFVAYKAMDMVLYSTGSYEKNNDEWYVDGVGFNAEVTHWMEIPTLKGGKE